MLKEFEDIRPDWFAKQKSTNKKKVLHKNNARRSHFAKRYNLYYSIYSKQRNRHKHTPRKLQRRIARFDLKRRCFRSNKVKYSWGAYHFDAEYAKIFVSGR